LNDWIHFLPFAIAIIVHPVIFQGTATSEAVKQ